MKRWDLIVIGTGLAGLTAARTAIEMGARVLIVGRGMGSLALFGNTIDVLGAVPPGVNLETGVTDWIAAHPGSPLRPDRLGGDRGGAHRLPRTLCAPLQLRRRGDEATVSFPPAPGRCAPPISSRSRCGPVQGSRRQRR